MLGLPHSPPWQTNGPHTNTQKKTSKRLHQAHGSPECRGLKKGAWPQQLVFRWGWGWVPHCRRMLQLSSWWQLSCKGSDEKSTLRTNQERRNNLQQESWCGHIFIMVPGNGQLCTNRSISLAEIQPRTRKYPKEPLWMKLDGQRITENDSKWKANRPG